MKENTMTRAVKEEEYTAQRNEILDAAVVKVWLAPLSRETNCPT